jgi:hypothetical protein
MSNRTILASILILATLEGCLAMVPNDMTISGYRNVKDVPDFWIREWEAAGDKTNVNFRGTPVAFKRCAGEEMVKLSPPELNRDIEAFIQNQNVGNYKALLSKTQRFSSSYEDAYGVLPGVRAGQNCQDNL